MPRPAKEGGHRGHSGRSQIRHFFSLVVLKHFLPPSQTNKSLFIELFLLSIASCSSRYFLLPQFYTFVGASQTTLTCVQVDPMCLVLQSRDDGFSGKQPLYLPPLSSSSFAGLLLRQGSFSIRTPSHRSARHLHPLPHIIQGQSAAYQPQIGARGSCFLPSPCSAPHI